jgi:hypothetical protein
LAKIHTNCDVFYICCPGYRIGGANFKKRHR